MSRFQRHFSPVKPVSSAVTTSSQTTPTGDFFYFVLLRKLAIVFRCYELKQVQHYRRSGATLLECRPLANYITGLLS